MVGSGFSTPTEGTAVAMQTTSPKLTIELVPDPLWGKSLANTHPKWDWISRAVRASAGGSCEICDKPSSSLQCHEVWDYDDERHVGRLIELLAICPACHLSTHIGRAQAIGKSDEAIDHLMEVNGWTVDQALPYVANALGEWEWRSEASWTLDTSALPDLVYWLDNRLSYELAVEAGQRPRRPPAPDSSRLLAGPALGGRASSPGEPPSLPRRGTPCRGSTANRYPGWGGG
jgi:hypothetical protein